MLEVQVLTEKLQEVGGLIDMCDMELDSLRAIPRGAGHT